MSIKNPDQYPYLAHTGHTAEELKPADKGAPRGAPVEPALAPQQADKGAASLEGDVNTIS